MRNAAPSPAAAALLMICVLATLLGCGSSGTTKYIHPNADLASLKKVAVLPFENVTQDRTAGDKLQKIFLVELLSLEVFDVVEPGHVTKTLRGERIESVEALSPADIKRLGEALAADAVFIGTVVDFEESRSGTMPAPNVTLQLRLVETQTGATVWSASKTRSGLKISTRLFGVGGESLTQAARMVVRSELQTLLE